MRVFVLTWFILILSLAAPCQNIEWQWVFTENEGKAVSVDQTVKNNFLVAGWADTYHMDNNYWNISHDDYKVVKFNASGDTLWSKLLGGERTDRAFSIKQISSDVFIVHGSTDSDGGDVHHAKESACNWGSSTWSCPDYWVVALNPTGDTL